MPEPDQHPIDKSASNYVERLRHGEHPNTEDYPEEARRLLPAVNVLEDLKLTAYPLANHIASSTPPLEQLGDFKILRELGRGGMGIVYEALQESLNRSVALKILPSGALLDTLRLERFHREARAAARLHHTNIVPVFGAGEQNGIHYLVMQHLIGRGLDQIIKEQPILGSTDQSAANFYQYVAHIGQQLASALDHAHSHEALHRDIKPANVIVSESGHAWLTDFGLAKLLHDDDLTLSAVAVGTAKYMAPEHLQRKEDARSDQYSLALSLFDWIAAANGNERRKKQENRPCLRSIAISIPRDLEIILEKALAFLPEDRYTTCSQLQEDLSRYIDHRPIKARRQAPWTRFRRWCQREPGTAYSSMIAVGALALAAWLGWNGYAKTEAALSRESDRRLEVEQAKMRADNNVQLSLDAFNKIFDAIDLNSLPEPGTGPGRSPKAKPVTSTISQSAQEHSKLLAGIVEFFDEFARQNGSDEKLLQAAAQARVRIGQLQARQRDHMAAKNSINQALKTLRAYAIIEESTGSQQITARVKYAKALLMSLQTRTKRGERRNQMHHLRDLIAELQKINPSDPELIKLMSEFGPTSGRRRPMRNRP